MKTFTRLLVIALVAFATLTACGRSDDGGIIAPPPSGSNQPPSGSNQPPSGSNQSPSGIWRGQAVTPSGPDVSTSFEDNEVTNGGVGPFSVGTSPFTATFSNGVAEKRGEPSFYISGDNAWHIVVGTFATVTFGMLPKTLSFSVRTEHRTDVSDIEFLDEVGALIMSVTPTNAYTQIFVSRTAAETSIGSMVVTSTSGGDVVIDDLAFGYLSATDDIDCLIAETLEFICAMTDATTSAFLAGAQGTVQVNGSQVTGTGTLHAVPGTTLVDGSTVANLTIIGTVSEGVSLNLTIAAAGGSISVSTTFDATYNRGSDLATVAGVYPTFDIFGDPASFVIDANGVITSTSTSACVSNGQIAIIDTAFNAYDVTLDVASCGPLNGSYTGLGLTQDAAATDNVFSFGVFTTLSVILGEPTK